MESTYKLIAAAVVGLALLFASTDIGNRLTEKPAEAASPASSETAKSPANAPQPAIIPAPNLPPPPPPEPVFAQQASSELPASEAPPTNGTPDVSVEAQVPAPMVILPAEQN